MSKETTRQLEADEIKNLINKKAGKKISFNLNEEDPTAISEWIKTGNRLLDSIICEGKMAGVPAGTIVEFAGLPGCISEDEEIEIEVSDY